jgi:hypothetical protein
LKNPHREKSMPKVRVIGVFTAIALVAVSRIAAQQQKNPLAASYPIKMGDVVAQTLSELLKVRIDFKDAAVVTYDPTAQTIDVEVFASPAMGSKTDQARTLLGQYWDFIKAAHIPYVERRYGVKLDVQNYRLMYYDRSGEEPKLILQFINGQYTIP